MPYQICWENIHSLNTLGVVFSCISREEEYATLLTKCVQTIPPEERLHKTRGGGGGAGEGLKVTKSFDILLSDGRIFMQQTPPPETRGILCSLANQFPTPTHSSHFTQGLDPAAAIASSLS